MTQRTCVKQHSSSSLKPLYKYQTKLFFLVMVGLLRILQCRCSEAWWACRVRNELIVITHRHSSQYCTTLPYHSFLAFHCVLIFNFEFCSSKPQTRLIAAEFCWVCEQCTKVQKTNRTNFVPSTSDYYTSSVIDFQYDNSYDDDDDDDIPSPYSSSSSLYLSFLKPNTPFPFHYSLRK